MARLERYCLANGMFQENCWLLVDRERAEAVLVDPGEDAEGFLARLAAEGLTLTEIWLTHAHLDHVMGVGRVVEATGVPVRRPPADRPLYDAAPMQATMFLGAPVPVPPAPTHALADGEVLHFAGAAFTVRHVPGHSPGHVAFVTDRFALVGDVLFAGSVGRVDLPGGDAARLQHSLETVLLALPDTTVVCPGHGLETTIGHERTTNPFLTGAARLA